MSKVHLFATLSLLAACKGGSIQPGETDTDVTTTATGNTGTSTGTTDACGGCPGGYTCGTANQIPVCRNDVTQIPLFSHVFVIVMENTSADRLIASTNTPFIHSLISDGAYANDYHGVEHPSLSNYIAMISGDIEDNGPLDCDCQPTGDTCSTMSCNFIVGSCGCSQTAHQSLADQFASDNVTWRSYAESMGSACNTTEASPYAPKHVPFLYFPTVTDDATFCADHVVDYSDFAGDLGSGPRRFSFITPNLTDDMHDPIISGDTNLANGEAWLSTEVPAIEASSAYTDKGLLVIVWDEDDLSGVFAPDDPIPMIVLSPLANQAGFSSDTHYDHYNLLATWEDGLNLGRLGNAGQADPLTDFFPAN